MTEGAGSSLVLGIIMPEQAVPVDPVRSPCRRMGSVDRMAVFTPVHQRADRDVEARIAPGPTRLTMAPLTEYQVRLGLRTVGRTGAEAAVYRMRGCHICSMAEGIVETAGVGRSGSCREYQPGIGGMAKSAYCSI